MQINLIDKKALTVGIVLLFIGMGLIPSVSSIGFSKKIANTTLEKPSTNLGGASQNSSWPMYKCDTRLTGRSHCITRDNPGGERWRYCSKTLTCFNTPVIDDNGIIYISSGFEGLHAINPNGTRKWLTALEGGLAYQPALGPDGTIYVGTSLRFYAIFPNGTIRWTFPVENFFCGKPVIGQDGTIYTGTCDGYLYALNSNGSVKWVYHVSADIIAISIDAAGNVYFVGRYDYRLYCLNPNGTLRWIFDTHQLLFDAPVIGDDGTIYLVAVRWLIAINPDGTEKWRMDSKGEGGSPALSSDGNLVYFPYRGSHVYGIDAVNGRIRWSYHVDSNIKSSTCPVISNDGVIYFAYCNDVTDKGYLCALTPDGKFKWKTRLMTDYLPYDIVWVDANPAISADGTVYITTVFERGGSNNSCVGYVDAIGGGKIQNVDEGCLTFFGKKLMKTPFSNTIVVGSINLEMEFFCSEKLQKCEILLNGATLCTLLNPPFKYFFNSRLLGKHTLEILGYYDDGVISSQKMDILFLII
jgi:outer membrane protein assembly factor BamB